MKLKNTYFYTIREDIKDEESISGNLLVRSGMIKKSSAGIYMFLPMGLRVMNNIENIVREEMNAINSSEVLMPSLVYEEIYEKSGRTKLFGPSVFKLNDRYAKPYILGPTHEELFAVAASQKIKSYKDLPFSLYQFQNKFRDEARPRYGLIRVREFIMKDAYTFDKDNEGLDKSYQAMYDAYIRIFDRMKIDYRIVKADVGVMGGDLSEEFQAVTNIGEDTLVMCNSCSYATNLEVAEVIYKENISKEEHKPIEKIHTPNTGKVNEVMEKYNINAEDMLKSLIYVTNENEVVMGIVRGNRELNELKLMKYLNATEIEMADEETVMRLTGAVTGFAGPIGLKEKIKIIADNEIKNMANFLVGANESDYHLINVNIEDFEVDDFIDLRIVEENDECPECQGKLIFKKGIEIGNTFKLGTKYAETLNIKYSDQNNELQPVVMGSYGIGIGRCMAALVEQNNDEYGIIWPYDIAPYKVAIVLVNTNDEIQTNLANEIYNELIKNNIEVLLDDREERPGVKFNDIDLIGIPIKITVGKKAGENIVEFKVRREKDIIEINKKEIINKINDIKSNI